MEFVLLGRLFGERRNLFFGLSFFLWKGHPFANDFSARLVVFHVRGSPWVILIWDRARLRVTYGRDKSVELRIARRPKVRRFA
jgi:hypothetical protein